MKRIAIRALIGSIAISAALGIYALLAGDFGELEVKVLLTSLTVSGASILAMACSTALGRAEWGPTPRIGIALALLGAILALIGMWFEIGEDGFWKLTGMLTWFAIATAHTCLLSISRLAPRFLWALAASIGTAYLLATLSTVMMWGELDNDGWWRALGVLGILYAAFSLLVPIFHRISCLEIDVPTAEVSHCPACGAPLAAPVAVGRDARCTTCGAKFRVEELFSVEAESS